MAVAREHGMRIVGPNCVGVINTSPAVAMNATFSPVAPEAGRLGFASQSGGIGIELLARAHAYGLGVSTFVSLGNKADVSGNDLLQYWSEDPETDVILLYLESFGNPGKFAQLAREISRRKPIIAMKSGRTMAGARGARSHTAALADVDVAVDELLHHTGVIRVDTLEELFDTASLIAHQPLPARHARRDHEQRRWARDPRRRCVCRRGPRGTGALERGPAHASPRSHRPAPGSRTPST